MTTDTRSCRRNCAIEVLAPSANYLPADEPKNNDSPVMRVTFGQRSLFLSGDVERGIEREMDYTNELRPSDVLKVAHHGSRTCLSAAIFPPRSPLPLRAARANA